MVPHWIVHRAEGEVMHALFVTATIDADRNEGEGLRFLEDDVLPMLKDSLGGLGGEQALDTLEDEVEAEFELFGVVVTPFA